MVDGVLLLVDASEGPLPQTRFVLRKALEARLPVVLVRQQGRPPGRAHRRGHRRGLRAVPRPRRRRATQIEFPIVYSNARAGQAVDRGGRARAPTCGRCSTCWSSASRRRSTTRPAAAGARDQPRRRQPTSAASRSAASTRARSSKGQQVAWCRHDGTIEHVQDHRAATSPRACAATPAEEAGPGEIIALAGIAEITIGETIADLDDPRPLPVIAVEEPASRHDRSASTPRRWPASRARS